MTTFIVEFRYTVDRAARQAVHAEHAAYLHALADRGVLLLGGPVTGENCGLLLYRVSDREELDRVLADEPYVRAGFVGECVVREWRTGKGALARAEGNA